MQNVSIVFWLFLCLAVFSETFNEKKAFSPFLRMSFAVREIEDPLGSLKWYDKQSRERAQSVASTQKVFFVSGFIFHFRFIPIGEVNLDWLFKDILGLRLIAFLHLVKALRGLSSRLIRQLA